MICVEFDMDCGKFGRTFNKMFHENNIHFISIFILAIHLNTVKVFYDRLG